MKRKIIPVLIVLAVLASGITACKPKDTSLVQMMKIAPENAGIVTCVDYEMLLEDSELLYLRDYTTLTYGGEIEIDIDLSTAYANGSIATDSYSSYVYVLMGGFNHDDICDTLVENGYLESESQGIEFWTNGLTDVAFVGDMVLFGGPGVWACIRTYNNEEPSMYENEDMKAIADKLPASVYSEVFEPDELYGVGALSGGLYYQNEELNDGVLNAIGWYRFGSSADAEAAIDETQNYFTSQYNKTSLISCNQRGQYIEIMGETEISR